MDQSMKQIIHTYKSGSQWFCDAPPGLGDFIRGTCHLFEKMDGTGCGLKVDISQTDFFPLVDFDPSFFHVGDREKIANAEEFFSNHEELLARIDRFLNSREEELYLCTNLGAWDRLSLPGKTRDFMRKLYRFTSAVTLPCEEVIAGRSYEVLSIRTGDKFMGQGKGQDGVRVDLKKLVLQRIEDEIIPRARSPIVITSDSYELKCELAERYGFIVFPHAPQHGGFGNALPVAIDANLLKNSTFNHHINAWQSWWSGFSHYTSLIFLIPSANFRAPLFVREEVTTTGRLRVTLAGRLESFWIPFRRRLVFHVKRLLFFGQTSS